jgi:hypothetical protein
MSILNCLTRLTIINHTGLPATFLFSPEKSMRLQPVGTAHVNGTVESNAETVLQWVQEFWQLISYGPTFNKLEWVLAPNSEETVRFQTTGPMNLEINWDDPSVSWEEHKPGAWSIDISKTTVVTMHLRGDVGEYVQQRTAGKPATVKSVQLEHFLEIACDEEIPFSILKKPISKMYWRPDINLKSIVSS